MNWRGKNGSVENSDEASDEWWVNAECARDRGKVIAIYLCGGFHKVMPSATGSSGEAKCRAIGGVRELKKIITLKVDLP